MIICPHCHVVIDDQLFKSAFLERLSVNLTLQVQLLEYILFALALVDQFSEFDAQLQFRVLRCCEKKDFAVFGVEKIGRIAADPPTIFEQFIELLFISGTASFR